MRAAHSSPMPAATARQPADSLAGAHPKPTEPPAKERGSLRGVGTRQTATQQRSLKAPHLPALLRQEVEQTMMNARRVQVTRGAKYHLRVAARGIGQRHCGWRASAWEKAGALVASAGTACNGGRLHQPETLQRLSAGSFSRRRATLWPQAAAPCARRLLPEQSAVQASPRARAAGSVALRRRPGPMSGCQAAGGMGHRVVGAGRLRGCVQPRSKSPRLSGHQEDLAE